MAAGSLLHTKWDIIAGLKSRTAEAFAKAQAYLYDEDFLSTPPLDKEPSHPQVLQQRFI